VSRVKREVARGLPPNHLAEAELPGRAGHRNPRAREAAESFALPPCPPERLAAARAWLSRLGDAGTPPRPVLVFTPLGLRQPVTRQTFLDHGITATRRLRLPHFARSSMAFYASSLTDERLRTRLAFHDAWAAVCGDAPGEVWVLSEAAAAAAHALKPWLRERWPAVELRVDAPGLRLHPPGLLRLQAFHLPDVDDEPRTWRWIERLATPAP